MSSRVTSSIPRDRLGTSWNDAINYTEWEERIGPSYYLGSWIITTPNAGWIPRHPPAHRLVRLRCDGYFADDDPALWPQPSFRGFDHLACIRLIDEIPDSVLNFFRNGLKDKDFVAADVSDSHAMLQLHPSSVYQLNHIRKQIFTAQRDFLADSPAMAHERLQRLIVLFDQTTSMIQTYVGQRNMLVWLFSLESRIFLEVQAYLDYHQNYLPRLQSESIFPVNNNIMGCFSTTEESTSRFHKMGIPVWLIRHKNNPSLCNANLIHETIETFPSDVLRWSSRPVMKYEVVPGIKPVYDADPYNSDYLSRLNEWIQDYTPIRGASGQLIECPTLGPSEGMRTRISESRKIAPGTLSTRVRNRNRKRNTKKSALLSKRMRSDGGVDGVTSSTAPTNELRELCIPSATSVWSEYSRDLANEASADKSCFVVDPNLFLAVKSMDRLKWYTGAWLQIRSKWIEIVARGFDPPSISCSRRWKIFLMGMYSMPQSSGPMELSDYHRAVLDFMQVKTMPTIDRTKFQSQWNGKAIEGRLEEVLTADIIKQVTWELFYVNFRFDFRRLEHHFFPDDDMTDIDARLRPCFPEGFDNLDASCPPQQKGLFSFRWEERRPFVVAMQNVVNRWPGTKPRSLMLQSTQSQVDVLELEDGVAKFYCETIARVFNRHPIVPHIMD